MAFNRRSPEDSVCDHSRPTSTLYSTAYSGSGGLITDLPEPPSAIDNDDQFNTHLLVDHHNTTRPALGSRFFSSLSNTQPATAALKRSSTVLHSRARSLAAYVPKLGAATQSASEAQHHQAQHPQTRGNRVFGDLFTGESAPVRLGVPPSSPSKEEHCEFIMEYRPSFTDRPSGPPRRNTNQSLNSTTSSNNRMSWFSRKAAPPPSPTRTVSDSAQDHLASFDIQDALFPHGPADALSPHAFNDLLMNATSLLQKLQFAYKEKVDYISAIRPEMEAQKEEVEEADTRAQHLKLQLEDMSRKANEQERAMKEMAHELSNERVRRQELQHVVSRQRRSASSHSDDVRTEDGDSTPRSRKRTSGGSTSDSGFESDVDNETFSVGSERPSSPSTSIAPSVDERSLAYDSRSRAAPLRSGPFSSQWTGTTKRMGSGNAAWDTVDHLRNENFDLRRQLDEMNHTLQGCIEFVGMMQN
ncbi:hypothetical protein K431DRAFT_287752 [Polychaeton citri CBS 116435]|uniref:Uncharacterized protein n=1 Tax=Polychaeton citri CBS 116435 TaxID=1314669 RepID=A0A9P4UM03_9PEZI|nr:hypothetical protein K431DRAFT_287752 [Polychaeton citri CBS 116435]